MKKLLALLLLPLSLPLFADRHIEGLSFKGKPQPNIGVFCFSRPQKSTPRETLQKNLAHAGFDKNFIGNTTIIEFITSEKNPCPFEIIIHTTNETNRYNEKYNKNIDNYKLITALFAHAPKMEKCLDLTASLFDPIPDAADPISPINIHSLSTGPGWFGDLGGFDSEE